MTMDAYQISPQQFSTWTASTMGELKAACLVALKSSKPLAWEAIQAAVMALGESQEILCTRFQTDKSSENTPPQQCIDEAPNFLFEDRVKVASLDAVADILKAHEASAFDFESQDAATLVITPFYENEQSWYLHCRFHPLNVDHASFAIFMGLLADELAGGVEDAFEVLQHADYAQWRAENRDEEDFDDSHWQRLLAREKTPLDLVMQESQDGPGRFQVVEAKLPQEVAASLRETANPKLETLAAWQLLIARLNQSDDVFMGVQHSGRDDEELRSAIGPLDQFLPLRTRVHDETTFAGLVSQNEALLEEAEVFADSFGPDHLDHNRLPEVSFAYLESITSVAVGDVRLAVVATEIANQPFMLQLQVGADFKVSLVFNTREFSTAVAQILLSRYVTVLREVMQHRTASKHDLSLTTVEEHEFWNRFNATQQSFHAGTLHSQFEAQVSLAPDWPAVIFEDAELPYGTLNNLANGLAHKLIAQGLRSEEPVMICMDRSVSMIVAVMGILKAGGCYLPIDPSWPVDRLNFIQEDSQTRFVVIEGQTSWQESEAALLASRGVSFIDVSAGLEASSLNPSIPVLPEQAAYIIYTSGSTGTPKGVVVPHYCPLNLYQGLKSLVYHDLEGPLKVTMNAPLSFDASMQQIVTLTQGYSLYIVPEEVRRDGARFITFLNDHQIDALDCTPTHLSVLVNAGLTAASYPKKALVAGGAISVGLWDDLANAKSLEAYDIYGPTECTVDASGVLIEHAGTTPNIGYPLANYSLHLLDSKFESVPQGEAGQILIGGLGLARGYMARPALTAEKFVPNPFATQPGERLYQTGDKARIDADYLLEFLGRIDLQVKVNGYRIELEEIEQRLLSLEQIVQAVIAPRLAPEETSYNGLIAYYVAKQGHQVDAELLRDSLQAELPEYMVPDIYIPLEQMPLKPNGKVDREALPSPDVDSDKDHYVAPSNPTEQMLCDIWGSLLGREQIGVTDNFFELGGDSILNIQMVARARKMGLMVTPQMLFKTQTIQALVEELEQAAPAQVSQRRDVDKGPVVLSPIQHAFFEKQYHNPSHYNQAIALKLLKPISATDLEKMLKTLVAHHASLRLRVGMAGNQPELSILDPDAQGLFGIEDVSFSEDAATVADLEAHMAQMQGTLDIVQGPMLKAVLYQPSFDAYQRLLIVVHHLCVDGVSWRILLEDIETLLTAANAPLEPTTSSIREWAESQIEGSLHVAKELAYWQEQETGFNLQPDLTGANTIASTQEFQIRFSHDETDALLTGAHDAYRTRANDLLLAALAMSVAETFDTDRPALMLEGHGRDDVQDGIDLTRTVGWFTSYYPIHFRLGNPADIRNVIKSVKQHLREIPNGGTGYGLLRYLNQETASQLQAPPASIGFNYLGQFGSDLVTTENFEVATQSVGATTALDELRPHLIDITAIIAEGCLSLTWRYSQNCFHEKTVERFAQSYQSALSTILAHCQARDVVEYTPSDFPLANLRQEQVDDLTTRFPDFEDIYGLSPMQKGILFHLYMAPESHIYRQQSSGCITGDLNIPAFKKAWQDAVKRHPTLRSVFLIREEVQIPLGSHQLDWRQLDWRDKSTDQAASDLEQFLHEDLNTGFEPSLSPPMRISLILGPNGRFYFVICHHHVMFDGWSFPIVLRDVLKAYTANCENRPVQFEALHPFRDYIEWFSQQDQAQAMAHWRQMLGDFDEPNQIVSQGPDPAIQPERGLLERNLDEARSNKLVEFSRSHGVTLNTLFQSAWALLIGHYSLQRDVVFGSIVAGRPGELSGIEAMVGLFINTLPVRIDVGGSDSVVDWLKSIQTESAASRNYEFSSLPEVQSQSGVSSKAGLFESLFAFENYPVDEAIRQHWHGNLDLESVNVFERPNYPLCLMVGPAKEINLKILFDTEKYAFGFIKDMYQHLVQALDSITSDPQALVKDLSLVSATERKRLLFEFNDTARPYDDKRCLHELFEAMVDRQPDSLALVFRDSAFTYAQMEDKANRLANLLIDRGVREGDTVGFCLNRNTEMVVAMLAILKAGATYVPMEPEFPDERIGFILKQANAGLLLCDESLLPRFASLTPTCLPVQAYLEGAIKATRPSRFTDASQVAYIIFTSGSTGRPKGVILQHRPVVNLINWVNDTYQVGPSDRLLFLTSPCFDLSVYDVFGIFAAGATIHLASKDDVGDPIALVKLLQDHPITFWDTAPAALEQLMPFLPEAGAGNPALRLIFLSGDWIPLSLPPAMKVYPNAQLIALGGATEAAIWSNFFPVDQVKPGWLSIPYGNPIQNARYYVLDKQLQPCPSGIPGDLYIGGNCLSLGYQAQPRLTAERYLPNPYDPNAGGVLYTTGDRARWLPEGYLEFLGRLDHQVKLRGYRIELGEIESVLRESDLVEEAVALIRKEDNNPRLVAYVRLKGMQPNQDIVQADIQEPLRNFIKTRVTEYMIPSAFVGLAQFPVTANGKLDRKALPAPGAIFQSRATHIAATTETQKMLVTLWQELLGIDEISMVDDFFELGGHSLIATRMVARIRDLFGKELSLRLVFEKPTIEALADMIDGETALAEQSIPAQDRDIHLKPDPDRPGYHELALPLSAAQNRLWFLNHLEGAEATFNMPAAFRLIGDLDVAALQQAFSRIVARHEVLRTSFKTVAGKPVQRLAPTETVPMPIVNLTELPLEAALTASRELADTDRMTPFSLENGPLFRVKLVRLGEQDHLLLAAIHHIVGDGWSINILFKELALCYEALVKGLEPELPELSLQYADYAAYQETRLASGVEARQLAFWRDNLVGPLPVLNLAADATGLKLEDTSASAQYLRLNETLTSKLKALSQQQGATLFMTTLAVFKLLLARRSGDTDVIVGTPVAGRNHADVEPLIGCFLNMLPLRTNLENNPTFAQYLQQVKGTCTAAYAHQDLPFERVVEAISPQRHLNRHPVFDVMFNFVNIDFEGFDLYNLEVADFKTQESPTAYLMSLYANEIEGKLSFKCIYRKSWFSEATMQVFLNQFEELLTQIVADQGLQVSEYQISQVQSMSASPDLSQPIECPVYDVVSQRFATVAKTYETHVAVTQAEHSLTYGQLYHNAKELAWSLAGMGLGAGEVVAVCGPRCPGLITAVLGVFISQGTLLLLDPNLPLARRQLMCREANVKMLVALDETISEELGISQAVLIDSVTGLPQAELAKREPATHDPSKPAYIFFTSGTTGTPNGVMGNHQGLAHFLNWQRECFEVGPGDVCAQLTGLSFDVVMRDMLLPLTSGATLAIPLAKDTLEGPVILNWMEQAQVSIFHTVPSIASTWLVAKTKDGPSLSKLRWMFVAGEPLPDTLVKQWRARFPESQSQIVNLYGPTETTLAKMFAVLGTNLVPGSQPVGHALPNTEVLILNPKGVACGVGEPGEVVIRTPFRSLGYLNPDERAEARFRVNPATNDPKDVLYFTGDRGLVDADGCVRLMGRLDFQIKIRGVRIAPEEVQNQIRNHPKVHDAVVIAKVEATGDKRLLAYFTSKDGDELDTQSLLGWLRSRLPDAMVPSQAMQLDALPLNANGKVDRRALPEITIEATRHFVAPETETETWLAELWQEVLELEQVGVTENFFELGGHSLNGLKMMYRIRERFDLELDLALLFEEPTIQGLSRQIHLAQIGSVDEDLLAGLEGLSEEEILEILAQEGETSDD